MLGYARTRRHGCANTMGPAGDDTPAGERTRRSTIMSIKLKPLAEQVIVITGASSGIGLVTARMAGRRGARLMLIARNEPALRTIVQEIKAKGGDAAYAVADVGDLFAVEAAADQAISTFGRIDAWVN